MSVVTPQNIERKSRTIIFVIPLLNFHTNLRQLHILFTFSIDCQQVVERRFEYLWSLVIFWFEKKNKQINILNKI